jgi:ankyrin repeat protein
MNALKKVSFYFLHCALWSSLFLIDCQLRGMKQEAAAQDDAQMQARHAAGLELIYAVEKNNPTMVNALIQQGALLELEREGEGEWLPPSCSLTPLQTAIKNESMEIIKLLLLAGANPDTQNRRGKTALMVAAIHCQLESMRLLLNPGEVWHDLIAEQWFDAPLEICKFACDFAPSANPNLKDKINRTALEYALRADWKEKYGDGYEVFKHEAIKLLIDAEADVNAEIRLNIVITPLVEAIRQGEITIVKLLLDAGANPFVKIGTQPVCDFALLNIGVTYDEETADIIISLLCDARVK